MSPCATFVATLVLLTIGLLIMLLFSALLGLSILLGLATHDLTLLASFLRARLPHLIAASIDFMANFATRWL